MTPINASKFHNIVVLTGAGVSVASGLRPYRGPQGVWTEHNVERYGASTVFSEDPAGGWRLFGGMRPAVAAAQPNAAHRALAQFEAALALDQRFLLVTQNVDGLHQRAGSKSVVELHGRLSLTRCSNQACSLEPHADSSAHPDSVPMCPMCGSPLRPDVVLFGESPSALASWTVKRALRDCDLFIAIGTSGLVSPASDFVRGAAYAGARTMFVNLEPLGTENRYFQETLLGRAEELLPTLLGTG